MKSVSSKQARTFADQKHISGRWNTSFRPSYSLLSKITGRMLSPKRAGVAWLASHTKANELVCDIGCGNGAYAQWFLSHRSARVIAVDWSLHALQSIPLSARGKILPICADASALPLKTHSVAACYSVDTLGHVLNTENAVAEWCRITKPDRYFFLHSECSDYARRWPDRLIQKKAGYDPVAHMDGHFNLKKSTHIHSILKKHFTVLRFHSPAGALGWLTGYPEKYDIAFKEAHMPVFARICHIFGAIKRTPLLGVLLRCFNILSNHTEILMGAYGGGSCFARLYKSRRVCND